MINPFFSIIIPTRGRSEIVQTAIESVLQQSFSNYEIILVDNDISDATFHATKMYHQNPSFHYIRTGNLAMADNWEMGYKNASGNYFLLIEDKMALKANALKIVYEVIIKYKCEFCSWQYDIRQKDTIYTPQIDSIVQETKQLGSKTVIESLLNCDFDFFNRHAPKSLNSCISKELYNRITQLPTKKLFVPIAPDFTSAYQQLLLHPKATVITSPLVTISSLKYSNGFAALINSPKLNDFKNTNNLPDNAYWNMVPVPIYTARNLVLNDYFNILAKLNINNEHSVDPCIYYPFIYDELLLGKTYGGNLNEKIDIFKRHVETLPIEQQTVLNSLLKKTEQKYTIARHIKNRLSRLYKSIHFNYKN